MPGTRRDHAVITQIARLDITHQGNAAGLADLSLDKRGIAPASSAEACIISKNRATAQALRRINRVQQGLYPPRNRNMPAVMQKPPLLTDRTALMRNRMRASDSFLIDIARDYDVFKAWLTAGWVT